MRRQHATGRAEKGKCGKGSQTERASAQTGLRNLRALQSPVLVLARPAGRWGQGLGQPVHARLASLAASRWLPGSRSRAPSPPLQTQGPGACGGRLQRGAPACPPPPQPRAAALPRGAPSGGASAGRGRPAWDPSGGRLSRGEEGSGRRRRRRRRRSRSRRRGRRRRAGAAPAPPQPGRSARKP